MFEKDNYNNSNNNSNCDNANNNINAHSSHKNTVHNVDKYNSRVSLRSHLAAPNSNAYSANGIRVATQIPMNKNKSNTCARRVALDKPKTQDLKNKKKKSNGSNKV